MAATQTDLFTFGPFGKKPLKEQVTPHKISLVVLIQEYCSLKEDDSTRPEPLSFGDDKPTPRITEREKRNFMVSILQLLQVSDLHQVSIRSPDKSVYLNFFIPPPPPQTLFVVGYTVFTLCVRPSVCATDMDLGAFLVVWR